MTTITIDENINLSQTKFRTIEELIDLYLKENNSIALFEIDKDDLPKSSLKKITEAKNNPQKKRTNFQG